MYTCVTLNKNNLNRAMELNNDRFKFNILNENFVEYYENLNLVRKVFFARNLKLLKINNKIVGYMWVGKSDKRTLQIYSMYVEENESQIYNYKFLLDSFNRNSFIYNCEKSQNNYYVLSKIGFIKSSGTYTMHININNEIRCLRHESLEFEVLKKGKQEELRCKIQNDVFKTDSRLPLTIEDMIYDELQSYYYEDGAVFIKHNNCYLGYGQVIISDNMPTIVNIGILREFRGKGYGKLLILYLLELLFSRGYNEALLKVSADNFVALNMYKNLGFEIIGESCRFEYKK